MFLATTFTSGANADTVNYRLDIPIIGSAVGGWNPLGLTLPIFNADANYSVVGAYFRPQVVGSTTVTLVHAIASTPIGSSVGIMQSTFNMSGATDVMQTALLVAGSSITNLAAGDQLGLRPSTLGAASGQGLFTVILQRI
jgi:ABC-type phosphate transport system permease subunit